jgi:hypothetical protein
LIFQNIPTGIKANQIHRNNLHVRVFAIRKIGVDGFPAMD